MAITREPKSTEERRVEM
jgi:hypothetical protein